MSFLKELQKQKNKLKETDTVVTNVDGQRFVQNKKNVKAIPPNTYGFVVDTKPDNIPVEIIDNLFIGSQDCTAEDILKSYNIKHILSLGIFVPVSVNQKYIECLDLPETNIRDILCDCLPYIHKAIVQKENILIHCNAGVSRTSMVAIAYLMHYKNMTYEDGYNLVKQKRPAIQPNDGFKKQLKILKPGEVI